MKIEEIYNFESTRNEENKYIIRFFKNGNWWQAYEWSAYLAYNFPNNLKDNKKLSVLSKHYKKIDKDLVYIGLQKKSFSKFFPNADYCENDFNNDILYFDINVESFFHDNFDDDLSTILKKWKHDLIDNKHNGQINNLDVMTLINEIVNYDISNKTMIDNTLFLNSIQMKIRELL